MLLYDTENEWSTTIEGTALETLTQPDEPLASSVSATTNNVTRVTNKNVSDVTMRLTQ